MSLILRSIDDKVISSMSQFFNIWAPRVYRVDYRNIDILLESETFKYALCLYFDNVDQEKTCTLLSRVIDLQVLHVYTLDLSDKLREMIMTKTNLKFLRVSCINGFLYIDHPSPYVKITECRYVPSLPSATMVDALQKASEITGNYDSLFNFFCFKKNVQKIKELDVYLPHQPENHIQLLSFIIDRFDEWKTDDYYEELTKFMERDYATSYVAYFFFNQDKTIEDFLAEPKEQMFNNTFSKIMRKGPVKDVARIIEKNKYNHSILRFNSFLPALFDCYPNFLYESNSSLVYFRDEEYYAKKISEIKDVSLLNRILSNVVSKKSKYEELSPLCELLLNSGASPNSIPHYCLINDRNLIKKYKPMLDDSFLDYAIISRNFWERYDDFHDYTKYCIRTREPTDETLIAFGEKYHEKGSDFDTDSDFDSDSENEYYPFRMDENRRKHIGPLSARSMVVILRGVGLAEKKFLKKVSLANLLYMKLWSTKSTDSLKDLKYLGNLEKIYSFEIERIRAYYGQKSFCDDDHHSVINPCCVYFDPVQINGQTVDHVSSLRDFSGNNSLDGILNDKMKYLVCKNFSKDGNCDKYLERAVIGEKNFEPIFSKYTQRTREKIIDFQRFLEEGGFQIIIDLNSLITWVQGSSNTKRPTLSYERKKLSEAVEVHLDKFINDCKIMGKKYLILLSRNSKLDNFKKYGESLHRNNIKNLTYDDLVAISAVTLCNNDNLVTLISKERYAEQNQKSLAQILNVCTAKYSIFSAKNFLYLPKPFFIKPCFVSSSVFIPIKDEAGIISWYLYASEEDIESNLFSDLDLK